MKKLILLFIICFAEIVSLRAQSDVVINRLNISSFTESDFLTSPAISFDGRYFIFVVKKENSYKLYECKINGKNLSKPVELSSITEQMGENTYKNAPIYNYDASKIYFSANTSGNKDIFVSNRIGNNKWSEPKPITDAINTQMDEDEPSISSNDNHLYFVRFENAKETECGTIYVSDRNLDHKWDKAKPIIKPLNSGCERTPRMLSDNKTLLFSSKRDKENDFKLYFAKNPYGSVWYLPKMIGNFSKHNDMFPSTDYRGKKLYFAANHKEKSSQIYSTDLASEARPGKMKILTGKVSDNNNKKAQATIDLLNPYSLVSTGIYETQNDGNYLVFMAPKSKLLLDYSGKKMSHKFVEYDNSDLEDDVDNINGVLFNNVNLLLKTYDKDIYEPIDANIKVVEKNTGNPVNCDTKKIASGRYDVNIPIGKIYSIIISSEFTKTFTLDFDLSGVVVYQNYVKNLEIESEKIAYTFNVTDEDSKSGISCQITLVNMNSKQKITTTATTNDKGIAKIFARKGDYYSVSISKKGYTYYSSKIHVNDDAKKNIDVKLKEIKKDMTMGLNNITFETNSDELNETSYDELGRVINMMSKNPGIKVEISAHTDDIGTDGYNLLLSNRRAKAVVTYLQKNKIEIERMIFKGYGEQNPLVPNTSKENRAKNRRVELKITEVN